MDPLWLVIAFILGFAARQVGLPPLVGYLVAGFALNAMGAEGGATLSEIADLGVTLLLFSIGLKLKLNSLLRPEIWAGTSIHMVLTVGVLGLGVYALAAAGLSLFAGIDMRAALLIGFALSFSSTVFAVKVLEEAAEMAALHGRTAIGILIMQDIIAIVFLTASTGKLPSPWALALFALLPLRPLIMRLMDRSGHGELLLMFGLFVAIGGSELFGLLGVKPDLGALLLGVLVSSHPKSSELAKSLLGFKDVFLVGFFLSIGLSGQPTLELAAVALLFVLLVPLKVFGFFLLLSRFRLRARTSLLASLSLANYSEFGLIVGAIAVGNGWLAAEWLVVIAIALAISFVAASPANAAANALYARYRQRLARYETAERHPEDEPVDLGDATIAVFGMGRVGTGAFRLMRERFGDVVVGLDFDMETVSEHRAAGRNVFHGDPTDPDYWARLGKGGERVRLVMLTLPEHAANMAAMEQLRARGFGGYVAATAQFEDQVMELKEAGASAAFNFYGEAGVGFAEHVYEVLEGTDLARA